MIAVTTVNKSIELCKNSTYDTGTKGVSTNILVVTLYRK